MLTEVIASVTRRRLVRLQRLMGLSGLSALILFEGDYVAYKLSLTQHFNIVLVTLNDVYVIADATLRYEAERESPWDVVVIENFTLEELIKRISALLPKGHRRVGVNKVWGRGRVSFLYVDLLDNLRLRGVEVVDATPILEEVFDKPYEDELVIIRWISKVVSKALEEVYNALKPGMREYEVAAIVDKVLHENGIVDRWFPTIVASGPRAASPHARTSNRRLGYGEPVIIDVGPLWMGYDGCVAHTFVVGRSKYWEGIIEEVSYAISLGLKKARPGTPANVLDKTPREELRKQGLPNYPHLSGHPIGGFYKPVIADFIDYKLEPNMVFAYEPAVYLHGKGGVRIEPHIIITSKGYEILTEFHKEILHE